MRARWMNTVMYPEISGDAAMKMDMKSNGVKMKMDMKEPKMDHSTHYGFSRY
jgi:hypothetical protein